MRENKEDQKARLAQALRDNLRRRKTQARASDDTALPPDDKPIHQD